MTQEEMCTKAYFNFLCRDLTLEERKMFLLWRNVKGIIIGIGNIDNDVSPKIKIL